MQFASTSPSPCICSALAMLADIREDGRTWLQPAATFVSLCLCGFGDASRYLDGCRHLRRYLRTSPYRCVFRTLPMCSAGATGTIPAIHAPYAIWISGDPDTRNCCNITAHRHVLAFTRLWRSGRLAVHLISDTLQCFSEVEVRYLHISRYFFVVAEPLST
jgi:hypothetical protein